MTLVGEVVATVMTLAGSDLPTFFIRGGHSGRIASPFRSLSGLFPTVVWTGAVVAQSITVSTAVLEGATRQRGRSDRDRLAMIDIAGGG